MQNFKNIALYNPWYSNKNFLYKEKKLNKRKYYQQALNYLKKELILALIGLRRTGKTTILRQLINNLLTQKIEKKRLFFYEFDEENTDLEDLLDFYFNNVLKEDIYKTHCYIFLDELQFIENWQSILKKYYDLNPQIKFIISGSTHLYLHKNTKESLAGRIMDIHVHPFSWHEFLNFKYQKKYDFLKTISEDDFFEKAKEQRDILIYKKEWSNFISYGEFPYFFQENNFLDLDKYYQESILNKIFTKDITLFDIDNRRAFLDLFTVLNQDSAQEINWQNLARETGISTLTLKRYINILEKMFLYSLIYKQEKSLRKQIISFKKGYVHSLNLHRALLNLDYANLNKDQFGHIVETFVYNELLRNNFSDIKFFHDTKNKKEVDFILNYKGKIIPIEVKSKEIVSQFQLKNLVYFAKNNNLKRAVLFYGGDELEVKKIEGIQVECVPYFMV